MTWKQTSEELPIRPDNKRRPTTGCLVIRNRQMELLYFDHDNECWNDSQDDDYKCDINGVEYWMMLPEFPNTASKNFC